MNKHQLICIIVFIVAMLNNQNIKAQESAYTPSTNDGWHLVWHDEFNKDGKLDSAVWNYEVGFKRNNEDQWYQPANAYCKKGCLVIEARKEKKARKKSFI